MYINANGSTSCSSLSSFDWMDEINSVTSLDDMCLPTQFAVNGSSEDNNSIEMLIQLLEKINNNLILPSIVLPNPNAFDGHDREKLTGFLNQCGAIFLASPDVFSNSESKVRFVGTLLRGTALKWYMNLVKRDDPCIDDWDEFEERLNETFGVGNKSLVAEKHLCSLSMDSNQECIDYVNEFRNLVYSLDNSWTVQKQIDQFKKGLPCRIRKYVDHYCPDTLTQLFERAMAVDQRFWAFNGLIQEEEHYK